MKVPRGTLGDSPHVDEWDSTDFSLPDTGSTPQLHKIRHLVLLEMTCGV